MSPIDFRNVSRRFEDGTFALREVSFTVPAGTFTTLLGPSGCGKSTLLRLTAGLDAPTGGTILIGDRDVTSMGPEERNVSMVFQSYALFPHLDVLGNVGFGLRMTGVEPAERVKRARATLALMGLQELENRAPAELSGGQQQRVALARALALEPDVLLFDEPLSNLDARLRRHMREEIRSLQQRLRLTVIYVTHDQAEAMAVSDMVVVLNEGRVRQLGAPRDIYAHPQCEFVASFMGDSAVFDAQADASGCVSLGPLRFTPERAPSQGPVRLVIRPEAWRIVPASGEGLPGKVLRHAYLGHCSEYHIETELGELLVTSSHADVLLRPGSPVSLTLGMQGVSILAETSSSLPQGHRVSVLSG
jgi:iron(III) transport system ATP-binding protein